MSAPGTASARETAVHPDGGLPRFELPDVLGADVVAGITARPADLGLAGDSPAGQVVESWMKLSRVAPGIHGVVVSRQVHGTRIAVNDRSQPGMVVLDGHDGHLTTVAGQLLAVTVADCVPVYLSVAGSAIALLHAGWRGVAAGGLETILSLLADTTGASMSGITVHLGVAICGDCYEVGSEVVEAVGAPSGRTVDLRAVLAARARALGVTGVSVSPWCSMHDEEFHSHRRDGVSAGRMVAYLGRRSLDSS